MASLGLGACLADDMGLVNQSMLAFLVGQRAAAPEDTRPASSPGGSVRQQLRRKRRRFAPALPLVRHYGEGAPSAEARVTGGRERAAPPRAATGARAAQAAGSS